MKFIITYELVMKYIGGGTLKEKLEALAAQGERLPVKQAAIFYLLITGSSWY